MKRTEMIFTDPLFGRLWVHVNPLVGKVGPGISDEDASSLSLASLASSLPNSLYISFLFCNQPPLLPSPLPVPTMSNFVPSPADATSIATIRTLAADVVGKANSGHPGQFRCQEANPKLS